MSKLKKNGKDDKGKFLPGNKFWLARSSHGPNPKFEKAEDLWGACCEYFQWVEDNPLYEDRIIAYQGVIKHVPAAKMRAMTIQGLCVFLDITSATWCIWRKSRADLSEVITRVDEIIYTQKFSGAASDLLNANIIARDLGLADKSELTGKDGGPIETSEMSPNERARRIAFILNGAHRANGHDPKVSDRTD